jgi:hypothetical protein
MEVAMIEAVSRVGDSVGDGVREGVADDVGDGVGEAVGGAVGTIVLVGLTEAFVAVGSETLPPQATRIPLPRAAVRARSLAPLTI